MRTLILSVLFVLAVVGAGVAAFGHEIPGFNDKHEGSEVTKKKARPRNYSDCSLGYVLFSLILINNFWHRFIYPIAYIRS